MGIQSYAEKNEDAYLQGNNKKGKDYSAVKDFYKKAPAVFIFYDKIC